MRRGAHALHAPRRRTALVGLLVVGVVVGLLVAWRSSSGGSSATPGRSSRASRASGANGADPTGPTTAATGASTTAGANAPTTAAANAHGVAATTTTKPGAAVATGTTVPPGPLAPGIDIASANFDLPDPYLLDVGGTYYMYVSTPFGATYLNAAVIHGRPGVWSAPTDILPNLPPWAVKQFTWTPAVYPFGNQYVMYFSSVPVAWPSMHCIGVAVSTSPVGPFSPNPNPLVCHPEHGGDIDAQLFVDSAGPNGPAHPNYLIWKTDNNSTPGKGPPEFWAQPVSDDGLTMTGQPTPIYWPRQPWQNNLLEAPQMVKDPYGRLWLFYSGGGIFNMPSYAMGFAACDSPMGPCHDTTNVPILASNQQGVGPGEETVFVGPDGSTWLLYNPWYAGQMFNWVRPAEAARIVWSQSGPSLGIPAGPFPSP